MAARTGCPDGRTPPGARLRAQIQRIRRLSRLVAAPLEGPREVPCVAQHRIRTGPRKVTELGPNGDEHAHDATPRCAGWPCGHAAIHDQVVAYPFGQKNAAIERTVDLESLTAQQTLQLGSFRSGHRGGGHRGLLFEPGVRRCEAPDPHAPRASPNGTIGLLQRLAEGFSPVKGCCRLPPRVTKAKLRRTTARSVGTGHHPWLGGGSGSVDAEPEPRGPPSRGRSRGDGWRRLLGARR